MPKGHRKFPILIVEDNPATNKLIEKMLSKVGHPTSSVKNGQEALELFQKQFFPIIITDWMMPKISGLELCQKIRSMENVGYVFIILLTARDKKEDIVAGFEAGIDDFLTKPINPSELLARLNSGIRILSLEQSLRSANKEIIKLSVTDPLTGCYNRRYLSERLQHEIKRAVRYKHPLSVVLCDIDHFKKINDTYGHTIGDSVLEEFANRLKSNIRRDIDWTARYGGEEFLIVLPETDISNATIVAEKLRTIICSVAMEVMQRSLRISASFGVSGFEKVAENEDISIDLLISQADIYLYSAKKEGRNRVKAGPLSPHSRKETLTDTSPIFLSVNR